MGWGSAPVERQGEELRGELSRGEERGGPWVGGDGRAVADAVGARGSRAMRPDAGWGGSLETMGLLPLLYNLLAVPWVAVSAGMWAAFRGGAGVGAAGAGRIDWLHLLAWLVPLVGFAVVGLTWMGSDWWHLRLGLECALLASLAAGGPLLLCWERRGRVLRGWLLWLAIAAGLALAPVLMFELWPRPGLVREPLAGLRQAVGALVASAAAPPLGREAHVLLMGAAFAAITSACLSLALAAALFMPPGARATCGSPSRLPASLCSSQSRCGAGPANCGTTARTRSKLPRGSWLHCR